MGSNSNASDEWISRHKEMFCDTVQVALRHLTKESFRRTRSLNVAVTDAMLVGLSFRLDHGPISAPEGLRSIAVKLRDSVRRAKALRFSGCESGPATCSFQPVAIGAVHGGNDMD